MIHIRVCTSNVVKRETIHGVARGARVLESGGFGVVVDEVAHALLRVADLPALRQQLLVFARLETRVLPLRQALVVVHVVPATAAALPVGPPALLPAERQRTQFGALLVHTEPVGRRRLAGRARIRHFTGGLRQHLRAVIAGARNEQETVRVRTLRRRARVRISPALVLANVANHLSVRRRPRRGACVVIHEVHPIVASVHPPLPSGRKRRRPLP